MVHQEVKIASRGLITPLLPPPLCLVLAERLKLSSFCSLGQRAPSVHGHRGPPAHPWAPRLPSCSQSFPPLCPLEPRARVLWELAGSGLPLRGASLLLGGMLKLVLCFLSEIEAKKACDWLRAAGFPQYAQLYEGESCLLPLIPAPALYVVSYPVSQPDTKGGCKESSQSSGKRTERIVY